MAATGSAAAAQDHQQDEEPGIAPVDGAEAAEPLPESIAQPQAEDPAQEVTKTIVVTGSRIPRPNLTEVSPVTVVGEEEVKLQGVTLTEELINQLPQATPDQGAFVSNGATGTATVDLRGLGASRTLVLVNGRRLMPGDPTSPAPDINAIPSALIQRVEVLTGGASSVYGSDAVAGVVNFILDTRLDGLRVDGQASVFQHDNRIGSPVEDALIASGIAFPSGNAVDGGRQDINAAFGRGFFDDRVHATIYAGYRELSQLTQDARDYSSCALTANRRNPEIIGCGGSIGSSPANLVTNFGIFRVGPDRTFEPGFTRFNYGPWNFYQRPGRRYIAGGFADAELGPALNPYVELMFMDDRSTAQLAPAVAFANVLNINCDSPLLSEQQRALTCVTGNFVGEFPVFDNAGNLVGIEGSPIAFTDPVTGATYHRATLVVLRRNVEGGPRRDDLRHKNLRLLGGTKGDLGRGISYDVSYLFGRVRFSSDFTNELSVSRIRRSLDVITDPETGEPACRSALTGEDPACVPWDIFALDGVTSEATDYLSLEASREGDVEQKVGNAFVTADLGEWGLRSPWADEAPAINVGAEIRKDTIDYRPDENFQSDDLAGGILPETPFSGSIDVRELFGEARIPLITHGIVERLALELGYRQSWYSNPESSFATDSYKAALDFVPVRGIRLRASQQRAVRAPNIPELFERVARVGFGNDPCVGPTPEATEEQCARTGVEPGQYGHILAFPPGPFTTPYNSIVGGNPGLGPERATTRSIGLVLQPRFLRGFNATVDWFDISLDGAIARIGAQQIMDTCIETGDPLFCSRIHRDESGSLWLSDDGFVDDRHANIGAFEVRGIDVGANYAREIGRLGSISLGFLGTRLTRFTVDNGGLSTPYDCAGLYGLPCGVPRPKWRHTARLTWESRGAPSVSLHWRRIGKVTLAAASGDPVFERPFSPFDARIGAQDYFDLSALFRIRRDYVLRLGVRNIFDREPPLVTTNSPFGACIAPACNGNTYPQFYDPLGRFLFAGVTVNF